MKTIFLHAFIPGFWILSVEGFVTRQIPHLTLSSNAVSSPYFAKRSDGLISKPQTMTLFSTCTATLKDDEDNEENDSIFDMLKFAIPTLGIVLSAPLLSNIDNVFIGQVVGSQGLAALSPATICTDQLLYLFSFLSRATTGIVSRAYSGTLNEELKLEKARAAGSTPLTFGLASGVLISVLYALFTPKLLGFLGVDASLRASAASYIYWRGAITWAALAQSVCLSILLATRDATTPLKIITLAGIMNVFGDAALCVFPFRWECAGAAAATSFATLFSSAQMIRVLKRKNLLPTIKVPAVSEMKSLLEYVGPLFIIVISRLIGFVSMAKRASMFGTLPLAAYQICTNALVFFLLFGEPMSQLHQTKLPALIDSKSKEKVISIMKKVISLTAFTSIVVGAVCYSSLTFGCSLFTTDVSVQAFVKSAAPSVSLAVMVTIIGTALDGAMLASRDFNFIIFVGLLTMAMQYVIVSKCVTLSQIYLSFAMRLIAYSICVSARLVSGNGSLGRVLRFRQKKN